MTARDERGWYVPEPIRHGTRNGAMQHYRHRELPVCPDCRKAATDAARAWRQAQRSEPAPPLQLDRARELRDMGLLDTMPAWQLAERLGVTRRTIARYRALLRSAA